MSLKIENLTKRFDDRLLFSDFTYDFQATGVIAILGESGAGKTTLLRIIAGLDNTYDGVVNGGGKKNVSFAFQEYRLFSQLTALENIIYAISDTKNEAVNKSAFSMLRRMGFTEDDGNLYPSELSGGMKQRVSLCRAFLKNAPILLLDEPTKELDNDNSEIILEIIREQSLHRLVIIVTHNYSDAEFLNARTINISNRVEHKPL